MRSPVSVTCPSVKQGIAIVVYAEAEFPAPVPAVRDLSSFFFISPCFCFFPNTSQQRAGCEVSSFSFTPPVREILELSRPLLEKFAFKFPRCRGHRSLYLVLVYILARFFRHEKPCSPLLVLSGALRQRPVAVHFTGLGLPFLHSSFLSLFNDYVRCSSSEFRAVSRTSTSFCNRGQRRWVSYSSLYHFRTTPVPAGRHTFCFF